MDPDGIILVSLPSVLPRVSLPTVILRFCPSAQYWDCPPPPFRESLRPQSCEGELTKLATSGSLLLLALFDDSFGKDSPRHARVYIHRFSPDPADSLPQAFCLVQLSFSFPQLFLTFAKQPPVLPTSFASLASYLLN